MRLTDPSGWPRASSWEVAFKPAVCTLEPVHLATSFSDSDCWRKRRLALSLGAMSLVEEKGWNYNEDLRTFRSKSL